jgi:hypothetical protein
MAGVPPKRGEIFYWETELISRADTNIFQVNPTIAAGDVIVYKDGALDGNIDVTPTPIGASQVVACQLSAAEMTAGRVKVVFHDVVGAEWQDQSWEFFTVDTPSDELVDAVWDEVLTPATHDIGYSAGQRLRLLILSGAVAQGGTPNSITLAAAESVTDNIFNENIVSIVAGLGAGQTRLIAEYDGGTKVAIVDRNWDITPNATSVYEILPFSSILLTNHGLALGPGVGNNQIELAATASAVDDVYIGSIIVLTTGTGPGQTRLITDYDGATQVATVSPDWITNPDATTVYKILPVGRAIVDSIIAAAIVAVATGNWAYATRTLTSFGTLVADIWAYATRTLTSFGTLVASIWAYATRTLTQSAATVAAVVAGSTVTVPPYTTWIINLTGLGSLADRAKLYATFKESPQVDTDANALIQVEETAGLLIANKAPAANPAHGSIVVTDAAAGNITITIDEAVTGFAVRSGMGYDVKKITAGGDAVLMTRGTFNVSEIVTRAIV